MKKTIKELKQADLFVGMLFEINPDLKKTKFQYCWQRFYDENLDPVLKEMQDKVSDEKLKYALTDKKTGEILFTEGPMKAYKLDREGIQAMVDFTRDIIKEYEAKEVEVKPFISPFVPDLDGYEREILTGLII